jgi:hypothetical protein
MGCDEVKSEKYQTRKSPPYHAKNCKDLTKKGKNGEYVSKPDAKGIYKWIKAGAAGAATRKLKGGKFYLIHDNGGRPYRVEISGKTVEIYKGEYRRNLENTTAVDYESMDYDKLLKKLTVKEVYVGKSSCGTSADLCGKAAIGNTLLLHLTGKKYMHIGHGIKEFTIDDKVDDYFSLVGNNDVPYPVLLGTENVYFLLDNAYYPRSAFTAKMSKLDWEDAYQYYYGFKNLATGEKLECKQASVAARSKCMKERGDLVKQMTKLYEKKMKGVKITK